MHRLTATRPLLPWAPRRYGPLLGAPLRWAPLLRAALLCAGLLCATSCAASNEARHTAASAIEIQTEDVTRFYALYEASNGAPTAEQVEREYLTPGTEGLRHLTQVRNVNAENIARAVSTQPELYANARECLRALPRIRERLAASFDNLIALYPDAARPPVTILISRGRPIAIAGPGAGVQVSLEALCSKLAASILGADIDDRFVNLIAHEYVHVQQAPERENPTVLQRALIEGVAEFIGELIAGGAANVAVHASAEGRESEIERRIEADLDKTDLSAWFDNTTENDVGQLGYFVGYRIAKAYYQNAAHQNGAHQNSGDRRAVIRQMLQIEDPHAFLEQSGWRPGIVLD